MFYTILLDVDVDMENPAKWAKVATSNLQIT